MEETKPILEIVLDGNMFATIGKAAELLKVVKRRDEANEMKNRVLGLGSYEEVLAVINEYVEIKQITGQVSIPYKEA